MRTRLLVIGALLALVVLVAVLWLDRRGGLGRGASSSSSAPSSASASGENGASISGGGAYDGGPIAQTIADRRVRDELRRRILAGWAQGDGETAAAAKEGRMQP